MPDKRTTARAFHAATGVEDRSSGSRWCFIDCRFRERSATSQRPFAQTDKAYADALTAAGWHRWKVAGCPEQPIRPQDGAYTCWRRDEFTLEEYRKLHTIGRKWIAQACAVGKKYK